MSKQIEKETRLSGPTSNQLKTLKKKQARHIKPMITLLVAVLGSTLTGVFITLLYYPVKAQETTNHLLLTIHGTSFHYKYWLHCFLLQPFIYRLYFKQICELMIKLLKNAVPNCKFNSVVP